MTLLKLTLLVSVLSFVLIFVVLRSCIFFHPEVYLYSYRSDAIHDHSSSSGHGEIIAKSRSVHVISLRGKGRVQSGENGSNYAVIKPATPIILKEHVSKMVNWQHIHTFTNLDDVILENNAEARGIYFSVKTTQKHHSIRLCILILTWMQTVLSSQVHIITDAIKPVGDEWVEVARKHGISVQATSCLPGHNPWSLCCKSGHEFDSYYTARRLGNRHKWFCHFDDDVYVNVPMLAAALRTFRPLRDNVYIGRWPENSEGRKQRYTVHKPTVSRLFPHYHRINFRFAVGAGYCISDALMSQLENYLSGALFRTYCSEFKMVDSMLVGVIIESVLGYTLIDDSRFNSHYNLQNYSAEELEEQITISYMLGRTITLPNAAFSEEKDPTRLFSYHCHLYAQTEWCNSQRQQQL